MTRFSPTQKDKLTTAVKMLVAAQKPITEVEKEVEKEVDEEKCVSFYDTVASMGQCIDDVKCVIDDEE